MDLLHFEDFPVGLVREFGAWEVKADDIVAFARDFDPQPFHLDDAFARSTMFGGLAASGWHTGSIMMRLNCDDWTLRAASMGGPGVEEMRWLAPVRPGDVLRCRLKVTDARVSRSRPEMGLVSMSQELATQTGDVVAKMKFTGMLIRRDSSAPIGDEAPRGERAKAAPLPEPVETNVFGVRGYYEDLVLGARVEIGSRTFEREPMIAFARQWDPQLFHLDDAAAAASHFGKLSASGWLTASTFMRLWVDNRKALAAEIDASGREAPQWGASPGFRDLRWLKPVYVGDTVSYRTTLIGKRPISRPGWAVVNSLNEGFNQDGVKVFEFTGAALCPMREG